jgi:hypothetical protein
MITTPTLRRGKLPVRERAGRQPSIGANGSTPAPAPATTGRPAPARGRPPRWPGRHER